MDRAEALRALDEERDRGLAMFAGADDLDTLEAAQTAVMGRRSRFGELQRSLGAMVEDDRRIVGRAANEVRTTLQEAHAQRLATLRGAAEERLLEADRLDLSLPGRRARRGSLHPLTLVEYELVDIFQRLGFRVAEGPEIEDDWHNFQALNIPPDHPARTMRDSLYVDVPGHPELLLRTETSAVQVRTMQSQPPPVYVVAPGRVYRRETADATHSPVFHQIEGLVVDRGVTFGDLAGTIETFT
nr:phenylalanine--tRNA ligase subunit alpha [Actinomycetota bacterium]